MRGFFFRVVRQTIVLSPFAFLSLRLRGVSNFTNNNDGHSEAGEIHTYVRAKFEETQCEGGGRNAETLIFGTAPREASPRRRRFSHARVFRQNRQNLETTRSHQMSAGVCPLPIRRYKGVTPVEIARKTVERLYK